MPVVNPKVVHDGDNSTDVPLAAGATFVGEWTNALPFAFIGVTAFADQPATVVVEWSSNASDVDVNDRLLLAANIGRHYAVPVRDVWVRVTITNTSPVDLTALRVTTLLHAGSLSEEDTYGASRLDQRVNEEKVWRASQQGVDVSPDDTATWSLSNPADSGIQVSLFRTELFSGGDTNLAFRVLAGGTIDGAATTVAGWNPKLSVPPGGHSAVVQFGVNVRTGGVQLPADFIVNRNAPYTFDGLIILAPGESIQVEFTVPAASADTREATVGFRWYEEPPL